MNDDLAQSAPVENRTDRIRQGLVFAIILSAVGYGLIRAGAAAAPPRAGAGLPAPEFAAYTLDSSAQLRTLASYSGSPVLLNVWATWCDPCREEMPSMQQLHEAYRDRGLKIVAISVDDRGSEGLIREFAHTHHLTFDILHDRTSAVMTAYQVRGVPQTFLISRTGEILATRFVANWASDDNRRLIDSLFFADSEKR